MNHKLSLIALATACYLPIAVFAEDTKPVAKSLLSSSAELGFSSQTGNTKSIDINAGVNVTYEKDLWLSIFEFDILAKKTNQKINDSEKKVFVTTEQNWTVNSKTNYTLDKNSKNYMYGNIYYEDNRFTTYNNQSSISAGWGRYWYQTDNASFFADIGPGLKRDVTKATETIPSEISTSFIIQTQALYLCQLNDFVEFKQALSAKVTTTSNENNTYSSESSITTKLIENLQLKLTLALDYNSKVDKNKEHLDTQTLVILVYNF